MTIVARMAAAIPRLLGSFANEAAADSKVIVRQRKFDPVSLAKTFLWGTIQKPDASDEHLARVAAQCGVSVTPQAIAKRQTPSLALFLEKLFRKARTTVIGSDNALAPILARFTTVTVIDSTVINLPDSLAGAYPGCGGAHGFGKAALKLQTELDRRSGALTHVEIEPGKTADGGSVRQHAAREPGSLRIGDLGYFSVGVFAALVGLKAHFLSRLHDKTGVRLPDAADPLRLLDWLGRQTGPWIDQAIKLGPELLACRLIAWRLPAGLAAVRRRKRRAMSKAKYGTVPSAERLAWCDWTILVTSVPGDLMTPTEAAVLYKARWQIELLFKRWKSHGLADRMGDATDTRRMVRLWSRLLAVLVHHWLVVTGINGDPTRSLHKVSEALRSFVARLMAAGDDPGEWVVLLEAWQAMIRSTCRRNPRSKPGTFELLNNPQDLDFRLS